MSEIHSVKKKALKSAKWMVVTSIFSMIFSYITNIILGNISPEVLGTYSAINVFISSLTTFVGLGGAIVLSNFIPKTETKEDRTRLLHTYTALSFAMYGVLTVAILLFPELNTLLSGGLDGAPKYIALFILAPIFVVKTVLSYLLVGLLEARISNIMTKLFAFVLAITLLTLSIFDPALIEERISLIVFLAAILGNLLAIGLGFWYIKKEQVLVKVAGFCVPKGFWACCITTFFAALISFLYKNADKMFLISLGDMGQLGYYQAITSVLGLVEFVPILLVNVAIPFFSNVIKMGDSNEVETSYERIEKYLLFFLVSCILGVVALSDLILGMFGKDYIAYKYLLVILTWATCISSLDYINSPMLIVLEKNRVRVINGIAQILIQFSITYFSISRFGILGVVLGRSIGICVAQLVPYFIIKYKSGYCIKLSKAYYIGVFCTLVAGAAELLLDMNMLLSILVAFVIWVLFLLLARFTKKDFQSMISMVLKR